MLCRRIGSGEKLRGRRALFPRIRISGYTLKNFTGRD
jgi:hypothetical protein